MRRPGRRESSLVIVPGVLLVFGCVAQRPIAGHDIAAQSVHAVRLHETGRDDILALFGAPDALLQLPDGSQDYRYTYVWGRERKLRFLVYTHTTTTTEEESLTIRMKRGVVTRVDYTNSANPAENRSE